MDIKSKTISKNGNKPDTIKFRDEKLSIDQFPLSGIWGRDA
jgi:hypothetical protein